MNNRQRRVKTIELTLTPCQIVMVWLKDALQAGTFVEAAQRLRTPRAAVANAVAEAVRNSMKNQPETLTERAVLQAQKEADWLYNLIVTANMAVLESWEPRTREYNFLSGHFDAEMHGTLTKKRVDHLRRAILMFIEPVIILDGAIAQVAAERLTGQDVLFPDSANRLTEQLQDVTNLSKCFNTLAGHVAAAKIDFEKLRNDLQSEIRSKVTIWVDRARLQTLSTFGEMEEFDEAVNRHFILIEREAGEDNNTIE